MKVIILAAGQGTRLRPFTNDRPKCMVELKGKPLLHYQLTTLKQCGVEDKDIALAAGYLQEKLVAPGLVQYRNELYEQTNMVSTLFAAEAFMQPNEDLIISYGDIVFEQKVFQKLLDTEGEVVIAADLDWYELWKIRMVNPLDDAETFKMNDEGKVLELGKTPQTLQEAQAQYIGLIKISANKVADFINHYKNMDKSAIYDGKDYKNMYMTSLLQDLIDSGWHAQAALINNGWLEVDSVDDLAAYEKEDKVII
ncbi:NTP transferase domain-containing protein [Morganella morganii]|uniref:Phosphocholine cytidylyltransferase family protein n=1 Tax=Morganella morganii TaxID=582 RepID=A0AAE4FI16_MORMO|nr:phosphocholine cytidylyltransferase family protein [Morganella morganii]MDS0900460.1 phosphocholine cytidylyltransferase family protein [Morganella morganii]QXO58616.1 phosphocholine cytidylyltransferase family protein [Morganella morganii]QXO77579.1 phosphocholine cytidylyltransferase family protein [Morganella morganii]